LTLLRLGFNFSGMAKHQQKEKAPPAIMLGLGLDADGHKRFDDGSETSS